MAINKAPENMQIGDRGPALSVPIHDERVGEQVIFRVGSVMGPDMKLILSREGLIGAIGAGRQSANENTGDADDIDLPCGLVIKTNRRLVTVNGDPIPKELSKKEFSILHLLAVEDPPVVRSRAEILQSVWGDNYHPDTDTHMVDVHVSNIKIKLDAQLGNAKNTQRGPNAGLIRSVRGIGFIMGERAYDDTPLTQPKMIRE